MWIQRVLEEKIRKTIATRPVLLLTGARQTGKTSLLRMVAKDARHISLDRILVATEAEENPSAFIARMKEQVILDEIQYAPSLFKEIKIAVDNSRDTYGKWLLTGSQKFHLMRKVSESLAGRIGILVLETLSCREIRESELFARDKLSEIICKGGFPELWANPEIDTDDYFEDYIQTYLERDLKEIINVRNLRDFRKMLQICALRTGQLINFAEISKQIGISLQTVQSWINALEASGIIYLLPPYYSNIGKRLVKTPKLFFADNGLLAYLLGVDMENYDSSIHKGSVWENLVFSELIKQTGIIPGRNLFFYRDQNGVEIDFMYDNGNKLFLIEAKAVERVNEKKLNFQKVRKLFPKRDPQCVLTANIPDDNIVSLKDYAIINPILTNIELGLTE